MIETETRTRENAGSCDITLLHPRATLYILFLFYCVGKHPMAYIQFAITFISLKYTGDRHTIHSGIHVGTRC